MKDYLGDGIYVDTDMRGLVLTTEDGVTAYNTIVFGDDELMALFRYLKGQKIIKDVIYEEQQS